jgi:hypothetical protein
MRLSIFRSALCFRRRRGTKDCQLSKPFRRGQAPKMHTAFAVRKGFPTVKTPPALGKLLPTFSREKSLAIRFRKTGSTSFRCCQTRKRRLAKDSWLPLAANSPRGFATRKSLWSEFLPLDTTAGAEARSVMGVHSSLAFEILGGPAAVSNILCLSHRMFVVSWSLRKAARPSNNRSTGTDPGPRLPMFFFCLAHPATQRRLPAAACFALPKEWMRQ